MTAFSRKSFSVPLGGSDAFRDNYDRIFRSNGAPKEAVSEVSSVVRSISLDTHQIQALQVVLHWARRDYCLTQNVANAVAVLEKAIQ